MAYSPHVKIQWGGIIVDSAAGATFNEVEEWSCTMSAIRAGGGLSMDSLLAAASLRINTFHGSSDAQISPTCCLTFVKVNEVDAAGHYLPGATRQSLFTPPARGGGNTTTFHPLTTSAKVSLDDGTRNRRAKGGFFVPRVSMTIGLGGRYTDTAVTNLTNAAALLVNGLSSEAGVTIAVASKVDASLTPVTRLRVGNVPDNISRRRRDLVESYTTAVITP